MTARAPTSSLSRGPTSFPIQRPNGRGSQSPSSHPKSLPCPLEPSRWLPTSHCPPIRSHRPQLPLLPALPNVLRWTRQFAAGSSARMQSGTDAVYAIAVVPATYPRRCRPPCSRARPAHRVLRAGCHPTARGAPRAGRQLAGTLRRPASQIVARLSPWRRRAKLGPSDSRAGRTIRTAGCVTRTAGHVGRLQTRRADELRSRNVGRYPFSRTTVPILEDDSTHSRITVPARGPQDPTHGPQYPLEDHRTRLTDRAGDGGGARGPLDPRRQDAGRTDFLSFPLRSVRCTRFASYGTLPICLIGALPLCLTSGHDRFASYRTLPICFTSGLSFLLSASLPYASRLGAYLSGSRSYALGLCALLAPPRRGGAG